MVEPPVEVPGVPAQPAEALSEFVLFARTFLEPAQVARIEAVAGSGKGWEKISMLLGAGKLRFRRGRAEELPRHEQALDAMVRRLRTCGAPPIARSVISESQEYNRSDTPVEKGLEALLRVPLCFVMVVTPRLAVFQGEGPNDRWLLRS